MHEPKRRMVLSFQITCDENASQYMKQKQEEVANTVEPSRVSTSPSSSPPASIILIQIAELFCSGLNCCAALFVRARSKNHDETDRVARHRSRVPVDVWHSSGCSAKMSAIIDNSCANPACFDACVSLSVAAVALRG